MILPVFSVTVVVLATVVVVHADRRLAAPTAPMDAIRSLRREKLFMKNTTLLKSA
jgi:hypothetical protein